MKRRAILQLLGSLVAALPLRLRAQSATLTAVDETRIRAIADVVLPQEIGAERHARVVDDFLKWHREYRAGAEADHGYGFTRLRRTPPAPSAKYATQLDALDAQASGRRFADLSVAERHTILAAAIVVAKVERLPARPDGGHVATDLMGFFFNSIEATDLAYRAAIGRDTCRALDGSGDRPRALGGR